MNYTVYKYITKPALFLQVIFAFYVTPKLHSIPQSDVLIVDGFGRFDGMGNIFNNVCCNNAVFA